MGGENSTSQSSTLDGSDWQHEESEGEMELQLTRPPNQKVRRWGFRWSRPLLREGLLVVSSISEDSVLDKWNLKRLTGGDPARVVRPGDRLREANGLVERQ